MTAQLKILQLKYDLEKQIDAYFVIRSGKETYYSGIGKHSSMNSIDFNEKFEIQLGGQIEMELWDYWIPNIICQCRIDTNKILKERKSMFQVQLRSDKHVGDLMCLLDEDALSSSSSIKGSCQSSFQPSFISSQGSSFYDGSYVRSTQYKSPIYKK
ncbi:hypothetical protein pb186bvf_005022 [Paramecium bursaria]